MTTGISQLATDIISFGRGFLSGSSSTMGSRCMLLLMVWWTLAPMCCPLLSPTSPSIEDYCFRDSWSVIALGDLHMEDDMTFHEQARDDCLQALCDYPLLGHLSTRRSNSNSSIQKILPLSGEYIKSLEESPAGDLTTAQLELLLQSRHQHQQPATVVVSLGDLGRKEIRHEPGDAGTTKSFEDAKNYLDGFEIPYELVTGNHDLEGMDEFESDQANLQAWMDCFDKKMPQFSRYVGEKTLLLGLSTVQFRDAPYSSHEVHIDNEQIEWFRSVVERHPAEDGWKILVFSHAPIVGSGLRFLQSVHVINGCAWLNHCSTSNVRNSFIRIVKSNPQIKCWASGHFHLSHEFQDSLVQVGSCTFVQVGVMGKLSTRDGRRQSRFFRGCGDEFIEIYSINHHERCRHNNKAEVRLDATIDLKTGHLHYTHEQTNGEGNDVSKEAHLTSKDPSWFRAFVPRDEDGCYLDELDGSIGDICPSKVCWWHMADGKVLGLHQGQLVEYDAETLAPLGVVVTEEQMNNREVLVVQNKTAVVLVDDETQDLEVIHPNQDGSYWRIFQRNKKIRLEEMAREEVAKRWLEQARTARQRL
jgi:hypothetical protein